MELTSESNSSPGHDAVIRLVAESSEWLCGNGPCSDIVISSRARLARNIAGYPFVGKASAEHRSQIIAEVRNVLSDRIGNRRTTTINVEQLSEMDRQFLMERQLISRELSRGEGPRAVILSAGERHSVMINEEDHLRLQVLHSGFALDECWQECDALDDQLESQIPFSFHPQLGYLTACPTNVGTGLRVSVMLHLPALRMTREIQKVHQAAQKIKLAVRGLYGEGSQALGDFYQISNQLTLGKTERQLITEVREVVQRIVEWERKVRRMLVKDREPWLMDQVSRAWGTLTSARSISSEETMHLLSSVRMGLQMDLLDGRDAALINELFIQTQPAHLQRIHGDSLATERRNIVRASWLQKRLVEQSS